MANKGKKHFHDTYFQKIVSLSHENRLEEAISEFQKYIETYPEDLGGYIHYANACIKLGRFDEAEKLLEMAPFTRSKSELSKEEYQLFKIKLLCCQERYQECLMELERSYDIFIRRGWGFYSTLLFVKKKLGILSLNDYKKSQEKYIFSQVVSYNEENAISHIKKHISSSDCVSLTQFDSCFPLEEVYFKLRDMLPLNDRIYSDIITNLQIFRYDAIGRVNSKLVDYLAVVTLKDSNEIITMYPYENRERRECIDLTPKNQDAPKAKRMSQIDKFNQRYGKKVDNN